MLGRLRASDCPDRRVCVASQTRGRLAEPALDGHAQTSTAVGIYAAFVPKFDRDIVIALD
jgi:hypothetical protein